MHFALLSCHWTSQSEPRIDVVLNSNRILDNLPIAIVRLRDDNGQPFKTYERGFPVGRIEVRPDESVEFSRCTRKDPS